MYTFNPIPAINTFTDHHGLISLGVAVFGFLVITTLLADWGEKVFAFLMCFFVGTVIMGITAAVSFNTGTITEYKNEPVTATFVSFQPEGYNEEQRTGKYTRRVDVHKMYVVYSVNGQNVILPATAGAEYPSTITLYKN